MSFKPVSSQVNLSELEDQTWQYWQDNRTFQKSIENRPEDNAYSFVDGPPFVTGMPHYGSLLPSIAKDVIPRYQTMLGKRVRRVWGWDCHGLPIEDKVNKLFGIRSSRDLEEKFGIARYVEECRKYVESASSDWQWYINKIGRWVDMENAYYTMNVDYMESVIWAFKQIWDKGLIYKGKRVSMYSTDTSTPVSQFEVAMDADNYRDVEDLAVFVKFELTQTPDWLANNLTDQKTVYLVAWTTTPWTIPVNFALALNPKLEYVLVQYQDQNYIIAKPRLEYTFGSDSSLYQVLATFPSQQLENISYKPVFDLFADQIKETDYHVILSEDVTDEEGTGVLHIAPAFGEVDFELGKKHQLSDISDIDDEGKLTVDPWKGVYLRDASPLVAEQMQQQGNLLRSENYVHRLPFYRGKNPLIYVAQTAYFIDIQKIKARMTELNQDINWIPEHIKTGRFHLTIANSPDWCISRNRYWATIMPIWKAEDGDEIIIGSIEEMMQYTDQITKKNEGDKVKYFFGDQPMDLHRDVCDQIVLTKEGKKYTRIPEVLDCWMDSGSVPFAEHHYPFENKDIFEKSKPADFIIEYVGQVRAWFNVLLRLSTILFDESAFTNVICTGVLAGNDGRKMSKSYGNYPDPKMVLEKYGGDALRLYMMGSPIMRGEDLNLSEEGIAENYRFLLTYWNSYKYFVDYGSMFNWDCYLPGADGDRARLTVMDRWILSGLTSLVQKTRQALDDYDIPAAVKLVKDFLVEDLSTWYIRRSRDRISSNDDVIDRNACLAVLYGVLVGYTKVAAPIMPFITEEIYRNLTGDISVHLTDYPKGDASLLDEKLMQQMKLVRQIVELGHAQRKAAAIKLRQPLQGITYEAAEELDDELEQVIAEELNIKKVEFKKKAAEITVVLETELTAELQAEGQAREIIRQIQQQRKDQGLTLQDKLKVVILPEWPEQFEELIMKQTGALKLEKGESFQIEVDK